MSKEITPEMIAKQMDFLGDLLRMMDEEFFDQLDEATQAKLLYIVNKYADKVEVAPNGTLH